MEMNIPIITGAMTANSMAVTPRWSRPRLLPRDRRRRDREAIENMVIVVLFDEKRGRAHRLGSEAFAVHLQGGVADELDGIRDDLRALLVAVRIAGPLDGALGEVDRAADIL